MSGLIFTGLMGFLAIFMVPDVNTRHVVSAIYLSSFWICYTIYHKKG